MIFGVIAAAWLAYLVPYFLDRRGEASPDADEHVEPFSASVTIVRRGTSLADATEGSAVVSTPLTRRAALYELVQVERNAARRRRHVLFFLLGAEVLVSVLAVLSLGAWWTPAVPLLLIGGFVVVARISVKAMRRDLAERAAKIEATAAEETIAIEILTDVVADEESSVELSAPITRPGSLWDPIPITAPTYVSKPLSPRTVRTIDLAAPVPVPRVSVPVTAEAPESDDAAGAAELERDAG